MCNGVVREFSRKLEALDVSSLVAKIHVVNDAINIWKVLMVTTLFDLFLDLLFGNHCSVPK